VVAQDISSVTGRLARALQRLYAVLRAEKREKWNRDLPFAELVFDRWERARSLGFGEGSSIYHSSLVYGDVHVGERTWIGPNTLLDGSHGLTIGSFCSISAGVNIYSHDTVQWALSSGQIPAEGSPVRIGDCTHIGSQSVIARGVTIGDHVVIGASSFVNRDIPSWTVAAGVPCRPIGRVELRDGRYDLVYDQRSSQP
jgi:acetyltransferase-like isoleucine patch superfamily enzyme